MDFAVPADHIVKLKESEKKDKYLDLARELKKQWNVRVTIRLIVIGIRGTVIKGLIKGLEDVKIRGRVKTIQTSTLLRSSRILGRVMETLEDLLSLKLQWKILYNFVKVLDIPFRRISFVLDFYCNLCTPFCCYLVWKWSRDF